MGNPFGEEGGIDPGAGPGYDPSQGQQGGQGDQGTPGGHPAFQEVYNVLPQEFHEKVSPVLKQWEQNVNQRFEQVHSKYGPWDNFIKQGVDPDQVGWAVNMLNMLEQNPREVYDRIGQYFQFNGQPTQDPTGGQGQGGQQQQQQNDDPYAERFTANERQLRLMTDYLVQQREQQAAAEADKWLDQQMQAAEKKYGKFDDKFVAAQMAGGMSIDEAVQAFQQLRQQWGAPPPPPLITGAGGGIANPNTDLRKMNDQQVSSLAAQYLQSAFQADKG